MVVIAFLTWGSYTKRSTVVGQLVPTADLIKIYVPQPGIVVERRVKEGQRVPSGDVLYVLTSDRASLPSGKNDSATHPQKSRARLQTQERDRISMARELASQQIVITAPAAGTATAVIANVGQVVDTSKPLMSLIPLGGELRAELYAPSRAIGFVKPGDHVRLRYQAYPYQKFGQQEGTVEAVAQTAFPNNELVGVGNAVAGNGEPSCRITVRLAAQTVIAYGAPRSLQAGMLLEADILQDTRRLYEWALEPLYGLYGKF
ncbi:MAG: HlyD family efflux transporter periplasmic adaptor subunit [Gammaproteobacteria bacterium]|nr:HlyD family efflux transporter periplasmic adaptor subunit [Gammaproteobacteria bacterium]